MTDRSSSIPPKPARTVSLVLGSGGARGLAHIGVIRWLEAHGYHIASISGCSIGALVGGIHAAGKLDEFEAWIRTITPVDMVTLVDIAWSAGGVMKGDKLMDALKAIVGDLDIRDLSIAYTAVAANLEREKEVWFQTGPLFDAIRASISLPFILTPFMQNGEPLVDGGILNPVPIAPTFADRTDLTIAVNLGGDLDPNLAFPGPVPVLAEDGFRIETHLNRLIRSIGKSVIRKSREERSLQAIAQQAFDSMQNTIARQKLAAYPPDVLIDIPKNACTIMEFDRAAELIGLGYRKTASSGLDVLAEPALSPSS